MSSSNLRETFAANNDSPEVKNIGNAEDTDAPSVSPISFQFFRLGLPYTGYVMLLTDIIPPFLHLALSHFYIVSDEYDGWLWFSNHFYAVLLAIPSSLMTAVLSDGYLYGKFIASIVMLTMMFVTSLCALLSTINGLSSTLEWIVTHVTPSSIFVFYVTLPIRATIFTDVFAKHRSHEHARKAFAALWLCNLTGVGVLMLVYQHSVEKNNRSLKFVLMMVLLSLNVAYFLVTVAILMNLPLELPLKNQFIYHASIAWYAVRRIPSRSLREKGYDWLEPALNKYTQTEVKRTRSLAQLIMLVLPMLCYASGHSYVYINWYYHGHALHWIGSMAHFYNCFYFHIMLTVMFIFTVEAFVIPLLYYYFGHFNGIWLLLVGFFALGVPLSTLLAVEATCSQTNATRYFAPLAKIIRNDHEDRLMVYADWLSPNRGKGQSSVGTGKVLTIHPRVNGTFSEVTVFQYSSLKVTDFLVMTIEEGQGSTYFLSPFQNQQLQLNDYDVRVAPDTVLHAAYHRPKGIIVLSCSPKFYNQQLDLKCEYLQQGEVLQMEIQPLCQTKPIHNGVNFENRPVLTILHWPARVYTCSVANNFVTLEVKIDEFVSLHLTPHVDFERGYGDARTQSIYNDGADQIAFRVLTNLDVLRCPIPISVLVVQLVTHSLSSALFLVSVYTIHCLHGPPRVRMTSYALPHIGAYMGLCIERSVLSSSISPLSAAIVFLVLWAVGCVVLTLVAVYCRLEYHSWDIPWRPSLYWTIRAWLRIRLHRRSGVKEKAPKLSREDESVSSTKGILQRDVIKDKTVDDVKVERKVTFSEEQLIDDQLEGFKTIKNTSHAT